MPWYDKMITTDRQQKAQSTSVPAPTKGINARDAIASMPPDYALVLDNCNCTPTTVETRKGSSNWGTGLPGWVETICHYIYGATTKLFAASSSGVYDVTSTGAVGAAVVTSLSNARFQWVNMSTSGGNFLVMVNGADSLLLYDGTTWTKVTGVSAHPITGVTTSTLVHVNLFKSRLWFVQKDTMLMWYLPLSSISGAASSFDFGPIFKLGGSLEAMMTWTIDESGGVQDYAVFITTQGEVAIYLGYDPAFASSWTLVGTFSVGRPIGRRCFTKMGSDVVLLCTDGAVLLSKELTTDRSQSSALTYTIQSLIGNDIALYQNNFGWQPVYHPLSNKLLVNVPQNENSDQYQYIMNTITGAWTTWGKENSPLDASCWHVFQDVLYYGGNTVVVVADTGEDDNGANIQVDIKPAFSYFGDLGKEKLFTMVRPIWVSDGSVMPTYVLCLDYNDVLPPAPPTSSASTSPWDTSPWDVTSWGGSTTLTKNWLSVGGIGYAASLRIALAMNGMQASLQSIDYVYEVGGVL